MKPEVNSAEIEQFLGLLREAPRRIAAATNAVTESQLYLRTEDEPWSVSDILAHLRASADVREKFIHAHSEPSDVAIYFPAYLYQENKLFGACLSRIISGVQKAA
jgi:hypothetical protein